MFIDTHCHLNFGAFKNDWKETAEKAVKDGVEKIIVVGADLETSARAVELTEQHPALFASVGVHPHHAPQGLDLEKLEQLAKNKKVVAIGECGLDYHVYQNSKYQDKEITPQGKTLQKRLFGQQIQLAKKLNLPLIIHNRKAGEDTLDVLKHFSNDDGQYPRGVFHCISGSKKLLQQILRAGFYIGIDANIVYSQEVQTLAKETPLIKILLETDSPYLAPDHDGRRNLPQSVKIVAQEISKLTNTSINQLEAQTTTNAVQLFKL